MVAGVDRVDYVRLFGDLLLGEKLEIDNRYFGQSVVCHFGDEG